MICIAHSKVRYTSKLKDGERLYLAAIVKDRKSKGWFIRVVDSEVSCCALLHDMNGKISRLEVSFIYHCTLAYSFGIVLMCDFNACAGKASCGREETVKDL